MKELAIVLAEIQQQESDEAAEAAYLARLLEAWNE